MTGDTKYENIKQNTPYEHIRFETLREVAFHAVRSYMYGSLKDIYMCMWLLNAIFLYTDHLQTGVSMLFCYSVS